MADGSVSDVSWDPATYLTFAAERARPFHDLVARVAPDDPGFAPRRVVDLGCGPGGLTASLAATWPSAQVVGVDSSPTMLAAAQKHVTPGRVTFEQADVRSWPASGTRTGAFDVIVTNATLQWVPGHLDLLSRWVREALAPDGWLALQVPGNHSDPLHQMLDDLAGSPRWADRLGSTVGVRAEVPDPAGYVEALSAPDVQVDAWETTYVHILDPQARFGDDAVLAWASGTALRPMLDALQDNDSRSAFVAEYAALLRVAYPHRPWGTELPFRRVFAVAHRSTQ